MFVAGIGSMVGTETGLEAGVESVSMVGGET